MLEIHGMSNYLKENCEAYKRNLGRECWMVVKDTGTGCYGYKKYNGCRKCPWFKKVADFHFEQSLF